MPANLENSAVATGLEKVSFYSNPKECSNHRTIALISHTSKVMLKILQARLQQYMNYELPDIQAVFRKARRTRDQIANICWIIEKAREFQKKHLFPLDWLWQCLSSGLEWKLTFSSPVATIEFSKFAGILSAYWAWPLPSEQDRFPLSLSLPSGSFHKPLILLHHRADRLKTSHKKLTSLITWTTALSNSMKLWTILCRANQDGWVMVERSVKTSPGEGNENYFILALRTPWTVWTIWEVHC